MYQIKLSAPVRDKLLAVDPGSENKGGFQKLAVTLQRQFNANTGVLTVNETDVEKTERYRTEYGQGGWQDLFDEIMAQAQV